MFEAERHGKIAMGEKAECEMKQMTWRMGDKVLVDVGGCKVYEAVINQRLEGDYNATYTNEEGTIVSEWFHPSDIVEVDNVLKAINLIQKHIIQNRSGCDPNGSHPSTKR